MSPSPTETLDLLRRLVAASSTNPPGNESEIAEVILDEFRRLRLPQPAVYERSPGRPNLVARIGDGECELVVAGHMDTMPPGPANEWDSDPFQLEERAGRLYGLGVADMKAGAACMVHAAALLASRGRGGVTFVFAADEEAGSSSGMQFLVAEGIVSGRDAVLAEPAGRRASWDTFFVGQRGTSAGWLVANGRPGHSGEVIHVEERASWALARAITLLQETDTFPGHVSPIDGTRPTLNVGTVLQGGEVAWAYPSHVRAAFDVRVIEGMTREETLDAIRMVLAAHELSARVDVVPFDQPSDWVPPTPSNIKGRLYEAARAALRGALGAVPPERIFEAATDASYLALTGMNVLPGMGPGTLSVAHQPNESIERSDIERGVQVLDLLIRRYLAGSADHS